RRDLVLDADRTPAAVARGRIRNRNGQGLANGIVVDRHTAEAGAVALDSDDVVVIAAIRAAFQDHVRADESFAVLVNRNLDIVVASQDIGRRRIFADDDIKAARADIALDIR